MCDDFETVYERYHPQVLRFLRGMLGSGFETAADLAQDTFLRLHSAPPAELAEPHVRFWLFRVARNLAINELRRFAVRERLRALITFVSPRDPEAIALGDEERRGVTAALAQLPEAQRAAVILREWEELSYEEIAAALQTTVPKVRSDLFRARRKLRLALETRRNP